MPERMAVLLSEKAEFETWLSGTPAEAFALTRSFDPARMGKARAAAKLGSHVTLDACRQGGMTELGDAELNEQGVMTLSGHKTPQAARLYVKRTERQRSSVARKRREWVEANKSGAKVRTRRQKQSQNGNEQIG